MINPNAFLDAVDDEKLIAAIHRAERETGATIGVHVSHQFVSDASRAARRQFKLAKPDPSHPSNHRGHVLIFIAPKSRSFAVHGDAVVHAACGPSGWNELTELLSAHFKTGDFTGGLIAVVDTIAARLGLPRKQQKSEQPNRD